MRCWSAIVCLSLTILVACHKQPEYQGRHFNTRPMAASYEIDLPASLWNRMESILTGTKVKESHEAGSHGEAGGEHESAKAEGGHEPEGAEGGHEAAAEGAPAPGGRGSVFMRISGEVPTDFMPIKVFLIEKNKGVLGGENHLLSFGPGGGELDLANFLGERQGTFHIAFEIGLERGDNPFKVFYLSNARKREIDGITYGAGCNTYHDITGFFEKSMKGEGIRVNTTQERYVSVLAGTYFFALSHEGQLRIAQVTIRDSRFRQYHCHR